MDIEIRYFDGCPNWRRVELSIREVLGELGLDADLRLTLVDKPERATELDFRGSPTILIDGTDPWATPGAPVGLGCRVYRTEAGLAGSPTKAQLEAALVGDG
jgi:hypothetical protein